MRKLVVAALLALVAIPAAAQRFTESVVPLRDA
jgi:hypothetical protein